MNTRQNAPLSVGSSSIAATSIGHVGARGQQGGDQVGVGGGAHGALPGARGQLGDPLGELGGVGEVAVVAEREVAARVEGAEAGLRVLPGARAGGAVPAVADGQVALQAAQDRLVEDLRDQAELLVDQHAAAVETGHAGRLLPRCCRA
jgi:hypothetical protein